MPAGKNAFDIGRTEIRMTIGSHVYAGMVGATWRSDGKRFAVSAAQDNAVYDLIEERKVTMLPRGHPVAYRSLYFVPGTDTLVMAGPVENRPRDAKIALTLLDASTGAVIREVDGTIDYYAPRPVLREPDCNAPIPGAAFDIANHLMLTVPTFGLSGMQIYDLRDWSVQVSPLSNYFQGARCAFSPATTHLAISSSGNTVVFDRRTGGVVKALAVPVPSRPLSSVEALTEYKIKVLEFSPDGALLIVGSPAGGTIDVARHGLAYRTSDYSIVAVLGEGMEYCAGMAFHPHQNLLALAGDNEVRVFQTPSFTQVGRKRLGIGEIDFLNFSPDGTSLIIGSASTLIVLTST